MRNLKRVLSLALALVMMLGMMIVGASAASAKDFPDAAEIDYEEAVDVISGLGIMIGDDKGNFNPDLVLTREQAAKIICYVIMGAENAEKLGNNTQIFNDVAAGRWSAGYIAYCANLGILAGYGNGNFGPEDKLTGVQFGKLLLVAAGYNAETQGYLGSDWATNIATDMIANGLDVKGVVLSDELTREQAAQMVLQAMDMNTVKYTTGNVVGMIGPFPAEQTFAEKYFPKLEKINGVVTANEYADLDSDKALAAGKTKIGGKTYKGSTALTDIGESRVGWANDGTILYLADSGKNTVFQTGAATSFLDKKGAFDSSVFSKTTGMKYGKDTEEYKQFDDAIVDTFEADIRIVYSLDGTYANRKTVTAGTTFKKNSTTYADLYDIFNTDDYETGWVLVGTTASTDNDKNYANDVSNDMSFKKFVATYLIPDEENTVTVNKTVNGDWLKVVDNDNDGTADYVFLTEFTMEEVAGVTKKGVLSFTGSATTFGGTGKNDIPYATSEEDLAKGDIILYTVIDGTAYVELAPNFTGEVDKYTYKTAVLTVDGEDYEQSGIAENTGYLNDLEDAEKETNYTYYQDFFGYIRVFSEPENAVGNLVLLTDAYYQTGKSSNDAAVKAYLNDELSTYDVNTKKTGGFIDTNNDNNGWDKLIEYADCTYGTPATNVARYTESDGVLSLSTAKTYTFDKKGNENGIATDYVDLYEQTFKAGETDFKGYYAFQPSDAVKYGLTADMVNNGEVTVQANKNTVFYYVSRDSKGNAVVDAVVVGYKNTTAVTAEDNILAMYAVASNVRSDSSKINYWVADVIVIETEEPVVAISKDVTLVYNVENKTYKDYAGVDALDNTAKDVDLTVISLNGNNYNKFEQTDIVNPWFYTNSVDKNGDSYLRQITRNYGDYGIYAATVDRENKLFEYFKTVDGKTIEFNADTLPVYDIVEKAKANELDDDDGDLALKTGESYIVYAVKSKAVYAIHVDTTKASDTKALYDAIVADATVVPVVSNYDAVMAQLAKYDAAADITDDDALKAAKDALTDAAKITKNDVTAAEWDALQTAIGKTQAAVNAYAAADKLADDKAAAVAELQRRVDNGAAWTDEMLEAAKDAINAVTDTDETYDSLLQIGIAAAAKVKASATFVGTEAELKSAISSASAGDTIKLTADIDLTAQLEITKGITLDGAGHTITADGYKTATDSNNGGILVNAAGTTIKNLTVVGPDTNIGWDGGEYGIKVYAAATLEDVTVTGANAGIQVAANTTLKGTIDVSGNEFGGIEVKSSAKLTIDSKAVLKNTTETSAVPTIWMDKEFDGTVSGGSLTSKIMSDKKVYYFLDAANA